MVAALSVLFSSASFVSCASQWLSGGNSVACYSSSLAACCLPFPFFPPLEGWHFGVWALSPHLGSQLLFVFPRWRGPLLLPVPFSLPSLAVLASHATYDGHLRCGGFAVCVVFVVVFLALPVVLCVPRPWCPAYGHRYGAVFSGESV